MHEVRFFDGGLGGSARLAAGHKFEAGAMGVSGEGGVDDGSGVTPVFGAVSGIDFIDGGRVGGCEGDVAGQAASGDAALVGALRGAVRAGGSAVNGTHEKSVARSDDPDRCRVRDGAVTAERCDVEFFGVADCD
jgi:hypothetical protein